MDIQFFFKDYIIFETKFEHDAITVKYIIKTWRTIKTREKDCSF